MRLSLILLLVNCIPKKGNLSEAIRYYEKVLEAEEEIAGVNVNQRMADAISSGGAFEDALPYYEKAFQRNWR